MISHYTEVLLVVYQLIIHTRDFKKKTFGSIFLATMMMTINTEKDIEGSKVKNGLSLHMDVTYYKNYSENMQ